MCTSVKSFNLKDLDRHGMNIVHKAHYWTDWIASRVSLPGAVPGRFAGNLDLAVRSGNLGLAVSSGDLAQRYAVT